MKKVLALMLALLLVLSLVACGGPKKEDVVGHWEVYDRVLNFNPDGTFSISSSREFSADGLTLEEYAALSREYTSDGSWELYGNTVKTNTSKFGFIDFTYKDGKLIDGDDIYTKEN